MATLRRAARPRRSRRAAPSRRNSTAAGLITCVVAAADSGEVLMVAHMNAQALTQDVGDRRGLVLQPFAPGTVEERRDLGPCPARGRDARRLRPGCAAHQGRAGRAPAPATPAGARASTAPSFPAQPARRRRSNFATPNARSIRRGCMARPVRDRAVHSALVDWTVQVVAMLPSPADDVTVAPFKNHIAVLPLVSRQSRSLMPSPL